MAWLGKVSEVQYYLAAVHADRGQNGRFIISGDPPLTGSEPGNVIIPEGAVYFQHGTPFSLAASLARAGYGVRAAQVVSVDIHRMPNPLDADENRKAKLATERLWRDLAKRLGDENWHMRITDEPPKYSVVVYVEHCPGKGDFDRRMKDVLEAFKKSGLGEVLYFDGTEYGPIPGKGATREEVAACGCPERSYFFYDPSKNQPPGIEMDEGYRKAAAWERECIEQALAERNPRSEVHRAAYHDFLKSAEHHIVAAQPLLESGDYRGAYGAISHAECDVRQAYGEAVYSKRSDEDLAKMVRPLEGLHERLQKQIHLIRERL